MTNYFQNDDDDQKKPKSPQQQGEDSVVDHLLDPESEDQESVLDLAHEIGPMDDDQATPAELNLSEEVEDISSAE